MTNDGGFTVMWIILIICIVIVIGVLFLSVATLSKGYAYKHTIDPLPEEQKKESQSVQE